ncbi:peptide ABC transporter substrate-binding protein [Paenactinomyces guangxiensis]|uniref:Peptide ABC transporter substrate-binding protein n=1 Tax=Paenactinomyces guangxiensis TaxID=1490290 RepID=A0A7W1WTS9_9BACL|nr:peptide ABC transporter substrate-binding protein [Paenactinomyces guangxiensis]MBA4495936.1 peptide ABC transporter substrate-binding protein [Paenactinomyces guangxiensis]MBH8593077.1 peptide ABC transporter substrate-binding protein [Paenactinomyces guangxiensis]
MAFSILAGCSGNSSSGTAQNAVLNLEVGSEPPSLDPPKGFDSVSFDILNNVMEGLTRLDKNHEPQPAMAEKWEISPDKKTYTFTLRDSKWSNGDPVTAHDFEFAWKRMLDPNNAFPSAFLGHYIEGAEAYNSGKGSVDDVKVKALDDKTLQVTLRAPTGFFLDLVSTPSFFPVHKATVEKNKNWSADAPTILSNGPFVLKEWKHDQSLKAVKNENYWDKDAVKIDEVNWSIVAEINTAYQMYQTNQLDAIEQVPPDLKKRLLDSGEAKSIPEASIYYYRMNTKMEPFQNKNIRKAFALAIDRKLLVEQVVQGGQTPALAHVPPGFKEPDGKDFRETGGNYIEDNNVAKAKELLEKGMKEEGYTTLPPVTMTYNTSEAHKVIAEALQQMYKKNLGVDVKLENKEWKVFLAEQRARKLQFSRSTIPADYADPLNYLELYQTDHPGNRVNYSNKEYDALVKKITQTADEKERFQLMHKAEEIFMEDMPLVPIYFGKKTFMEKPHVTGIVRHPVGNRELKWAQITKK